VKISSNTLNILPFLGPKILKFMGENAPASSKVNGTTRYNFMGPGALNFS
jgi:hypothetical protein